MYGAISKAFAYTRKSSMQPLIFSTSITAATKKSYELCVLTPPDKVLLDDELEEGKLYLRKIADKYGKDQIVYTVKTPKGTIVRDRVLDKLKVPDPFTLDNLKSIELEILMLTDKEGHTELVENKEAQEFAARLAKSEQWEYLHKVTKEKADYVDKDGATWLQVAVCKNDLSLVKELLESGADPNSRNSNGETPLQLAIAVGTFEIISVFIDHVKLSDFEKLLKIAKKYGRSDEILDALNQGKSLVEREHDSSKTGAGQKDSLESESKNYEGTEKSNYLNKKESFQSDQDYLSQDRQSDTIDLRTLASGEDRYPPQSGEDRYPPQAMNDMQGSDMQRHTDGLPDLSTQVHSTNIDSIQGGDLDLEEVRKVEVLPDIFQVLSRDLSSDAAKLAYVRAVYEFKDRLDFENPGNSNPKYDPNILAEAGKANLEAAKLILGSCIGRCLSMEDRVKIYCVHLRSPDFHIFLRSNEIDAQSTLAVLLKNDPMKHIQMMQCISEAIKQATPEQAAPVADNKGINRAEQQPQQSQAAQAQQDQTNQQSHVTQPDPDQPSRQKIDPSLSPKIGSRE